MASKNKIKLFFGAGLALAVGAVFADTQTTTDVVSQTFEGATGGSIGNTLTGWSGEGTVDTVVGTIPIGNSVDRPITDTGTKFLAIAGEVTCTGSETTDDCYVSDFLVKITEGSDGKLEEPNGVQIAVAAGQADTETEAIPLCVYSKDKSDSAGWTTSSIVIDKTKWHRLTLVFDYGNKTCQVNWDGVPVATSAGYLDSDPASTKNTDGETPIAGSWYKLATSASDNKSSIKSLKFVGAASIDDVLVKQGTKMAVTPSSYGQNAVAAVTLDGANVTIPVNDLSEWGVGEANITTAKIDDSGLTVAEKLAAGLEPDDGKKFEFTEMALGSGNTANTATIKFRGSMAANHGVLPSYTVKVNETAVAMTGATGKDGIVTASIPLFDVPVNKITIEATATAPTSTSTQTTAAN